MTKVLLSTLEISRLGVNQIFSQPKKKYRNGVKMSSKRATTSKALKM